MIKLEEFKKYKEVLEETITNKAFRSRMMFEVIDDEIFGMRILKYINILSGNITSEELNNVFNDIRKDTIDYYEKSKKSETKNDKIFFALRSLAYFYFLESMDEHSTLSDGIVEEIQRHIYELGNDVRLVKMQLEELIRRIRKRRNANNKRLHST